MRPSFVAGHLMKALVLYTLAERKFAAMAGEALDAARAHASSANDRERGLMAAGDALVDGRWHDACAALDRVLANAPRDALALQVGTPHGLLPRRRAQPAQSRVARTAALGRVGPRAIRTFSACTLSASRR